MYYSFDFAANITQLCMEEIRDRGLQERKIFRKSLPNSGLFIKVFSKQTCKREDLQHVDIHSVATLMQDALWSSHERIISKKAWRTINYETCTLSKLSSVISSKSEQFLIEILDFLTEVMHYKNVNLMDAYKLGDALGKVVLGPSDCGPIMAEKAGHFLTRMIIEHAKIQHQRNYNKKLVRRIDSGFDSSYSCHSFYNEHHPICKAQGTQARAKFYNRDIKKTQWVTFDWCDNAVGVRAMLDNEYELIPEPPEKPWVSIFTSAEHLMKPDVAALPVLGRILREAIKPKPSESNDPFETSYLFNQSKAYWTERQIHEAFNEFNSQLDTNYHFYDLDDRHNNPLKKLNHSLSHLKLNIKKYRSRHDLLNDSDTDDQSSQYDEQEVPKANESVISVMKKMMKFGGQQSRDGKSANIVI